jgi:hypothetical protein
MAAARNGGALSSIALNGIVLGGIAIGGGGPKIQRGICE